MKKIGMFIYCLLLIISPVTGGSQVNGDMAPIGSSYGNIQQESTQHDEMLSSEAQPIEKVKIQVNETPDSKEIPPEIPKSKRDTDSDIYQLQIIIGDQNFSAVLYKNETTTKLMKRLPMTLDMRDMNGNEKYYYFADSMPTSPKKTSAIHAGDLMLYGSDCLVLFYESFSSQYSYTKLGTITDATGLASALGSGNTQVSFSTE